MHASSSRAIVLSLVGLALAACGSDSSTGTGTNSGGSGGTGGTVHGTGSTANHLAAAAFDSIPEEYVQRAKSNLRIFYGHTSHGHQLIVGLEMLQSELYDFNDGAGTLSLHDYSEGIDLGTGTDWIGATRNALAQGDFNVVMWSWCGQVSGSSTGEIDAYLEAMNQLEQDYPDVAFVYMTGHTDGNGDDGTLHTNNERIRDYCAANGKWLYDFEDIESWTPANDYQEGTSDSCEWCSTWCDENQCPDPVISGDFDYCDHSHPFNCYLKGKAFWWLLARMAGWNG